MRKIIQLYFLLFFSFAFSQTELVFVYFKDKPNASIFLSNPLSELTQKSINRRTNLNIPITEQDAPIETSYIQNIQNLGFTVTDQSKWLNGVAVNATFAQITQLQSEPYVLKVESFVKNSTVAKQAKISRIEKFLNSTTDFTYGNSLDQINQINLRNLHVNGYTGAGISIAVIDTGFPTVDTGSAFARIRNNNQIKGGYNFVNKSTDIYNTSLNNHGTNCLGIIAGYIDGIFVGSAPDADFYLYASENSALEIPEEELYWIEAAEEADRQGVDIISTSLGYNTFDDSKYNYTYADMNGQKSFIARGVNIASDKGIFVLIASGNEGNKTWHYITTPSDSEKAFSIGAVDSSGNASVFTSFGPNSNNSIKPDASARGTSTYYTYNNSSYFGNGTSYATPLSAGGVACLLQAIPNNTNRETIKNKLRETASLYPSFDNQTGYGILNFSNALSSINASLNISEIKRPVVNIYPNPAKSFIHIKTNEKLKNIELYDEIGKKLKTLPLNYSQNIESLNKGIYYLKIQTEKSSTVEKIIKE